MLIKPLYLLAHSQLLFWKETGQGFMDRLRADADSATPKAAYIGASNGDSPEAYGIFEAAFDQVQTTSTHWVRAQFRAEDRRFLESADVIVLAGGDVEATAGAC